MYVPFLHGLIQPQIFYLILVEKRITDVNVIYFENYIAIPSKIISVFSVSEVQIEYYLNLTNWYDITVKEFDTSI